MANIGTFKKSGSELQGEIATLASRREKKNASSPKPKTGPTDNAPQPPHSLAGPSIGRAGQASKRRLGAPHPSGQARRSGASVSDLRDLFDDEDGEPPSLIWLRSRKSNH